jgi:hypothetical protein
MKKHWLSLLAIVAALVVIGCAGDTPQDELGTTDTGTTSTTSSTNGSTAGTTGASAFQGFFQGSFSGSNTTGSQFTGSGGADIDANGDAFFAFDARIGGAQYYREFDGRISANGTFTGFTDTGESTRGTVSRSGNNLTATLIWDKRRADGSIFYTETEHFDLTLQ